MNDMALRIDDFGKPAWIALMVIGFIVFWPIGLAILAYMIWSGRMGCGRHHRGEWGGHKFKEKFGKWSGPTGSQYATGNRAFDEYRAETLRRLEDEARDFESFLDRLRMAKDKAEFDEFMADRRANPPPPPPRPEGPEAEKPAGT